MFDFNISTGYPHDAPKVKCLTKVGCRFPHASVCLRSCGCCTSPLPRLTDAAACQAIQMVDKLSPATHMFDFCRRSAAPLTCPLATHRCTTPTSTWRATSASTSCGRTGSRCCLSTPWCSGSTTCSWCAPSVRISISFHHDQLLPSLRTSARLPACHLSAWLWLRLCLRPPMWTLGFEAALYSDMFATHSKVALIENQGD